MVAARPLPAAEALWYDALIRPSEALLASARYLIVIPDRRWPRSRMRP